MYKEMGDQINANKILHSSAIDLRTWIENMNITTTRPLCKKLLSKVSIF